MTKISVEEYISKVDNLADFTVELLKDNHDLVACLKLTKSSISKLFEKGLKSTKPLKYVLEIIDETLKDYE